MAFTMNPPELPQLGNQPVVLAIAMFSTGPAKQPLFLRWSRTNTMGYGLVRLVCLVRKSQVGALKKKIDFKGEKPAACSLHSQKGK